MYLKVKMYFLVKVFLSWRVLDSNHKSTKQVIGVQLITICMRTVVQVWIPYQSRVIQQQLGGLYLIHQSDTKGFQNLDNVVLVYVGLPR